MSGRPPGTVVVLHHNTGDQYPLRSSVADHLFAWRRHSGYRTVYVNVAFGPHLAAIRALAPSAVVLHTTLLSTRWAPELFRSVTAPLAPLADLGCAKVAVPQDEFIHTRLLDDFLAEVGVTHVLSCAASPDWPKIYPRSVARAHFRTVLTGYLEDATVARVAALEAAAVRPVDVGYRAWKAAAWLGRWGRHKVLVAELVEPAARARGLTTDISLRPGDTLLGDDWFRFLLSCRAVVGVEGGASILDVDGAIKDRVETYVCDNPDAAYEEVEAACFPGLEGGLGLRALSPRHLESALTRTAQLLVEGDYNGVLVPGRHYFPLRADYSNLDAALDFLDDAEAVEAMTARAHADLVLSGAVSYRSFVRAFDAEVAAFATTASSARWGGAAGTYLRLLERLSWRRVQLTAVRLREARGPVGRWLRWLARTAAYRVRRLRSLTGRT